MMVVTLYIWCRLQNAAVGAWSVPPLPCVPDVAPPSFCLRGCVSSSVPPPRPLTHSTVCAKVNYRMCKYMQFYLLNLQTCAICACMI